jgi:hypothetical protein
MPETEHQQRGEPNEKLVRVFDSKEESEAMVVRGLLESSGIPCIITSPEAAQDIFPGVGGTIILVREEQAQEAREIIAANRADLSDMPDSAA